MRRGELRPRHAHDRRRRERVWREQQRERARLATAAFRRDEELGGRGEQAAGATRTIGGVEDETKDEQEDWEEHVCEISGLPYYWSPSRHRSSWTAPGAFADEDLEYDDFLTSQPSIFGSANPLHAARGGASFI